jgi:transposase
MSIRVIIPKKDLQIINSKRKSEKQSKFLRRYQCLWMLQEGYLKKDIASILSVNIDTITDWIKIYNKSGLSGLGLLHYEDRRPSILDNRKAEIKSLVIKENVSTIKALQSKIYIEFGLEVEHSWLYRYCNEIILQS